MTTQPTLTVITIGRDSIAGLRETRASVESQTYADLHHLLIDGASTDGSAELVARWAGDNEQVTAISEPDSGIYDAMNRALDRIDTDHLMFVHAGDTFVDTDAVQRSMLAISNAATTPDLAIGWSRFATDAGLLPYVVGGPTPNAITSAHESTIFSQAFHQHERYNSDLKLAADYAFFRDLAQRDDIDVLRLDFTIANFVFGGRSNDPSYDGPRFLERARIDASFGDPVSARTYLRIGLRMLVRKVVYRVAGPDRAAVVFLRLACRRGNSGAQELPVGQVYVASRSAG